MEKPGRGHNNENPERKFMLGISAQTRKSDIRFSVTHLVRIVGCITPERDVLTVQIRRCLPELALFINPDFLRLFSLLFHSG